MGSVAEAQATSTTQTVRDVHGKGVEAVQEVLKPTAQGPMDGEGTEAFR